MEDFFSEHSLICPWQHTCPELDQTYSRIRYAQHIVGPSHRCLQLYSLLGIYSVFVDTYCYFRVWVLLFRTDDTYILYISSLFPLLFQYNTQ